MHRDERGATAVEYAVVAAAIVAVIVALVIAIGLQVQGEFGDACDEMESAGITGGPCPP